MVRAICYGLLACLMFVCILEANPPPTQPTDGMEPYNKLFRAIHLVESGGQANPKDGDGGKAIGPYQIHEGYWKDAYDHSVKLGDPFNIQFKHDAEGKKIECTYQDVRTKQYAERVMLAYWDRYDRAALEKPNYEKLARLHNGGPTGWKSEAARKYWLRVRERIR